PKRAALAVSPLWRGALGAARRVNGAPAAEEEALLEAQVDVHSFSPAQLRGMLAGAGLERPRVRGEELLANVYGWSVRTLESTAEPDEVPIRWRMFAFRAYLALQRVDTAVLEPRLPAELFYNLVLSARKSVALGA
ncbi:MAG: class I SAM-dependent methyltransferase, partial [Solirubrobacterales bacterium]